MATAVDGWRKASFSGQGACVEVHPSNDMVCIRDSKDPEGGWFAVDRAAFHVFLADCKAGRYDHLVNEA